MKPGGETAVAVQVAYELWVWLDERVVDFPAHARRAIGERILQEAIDLMGDLASASYSPRASTRRSSHLERASDRITLMRLLLRGARDNASSAGGWQARTFGLPSGIGTMAKAPVADRYGTVDVVKRGRTTGVTRGRVSAFELDDVAPPRYPEGSLSLAPLWRSSSPRLEQTRRPPCGERDTRGVLPGGVDREPHRGAVPHRCYSPRGIAGSFGFGQAERMSSAIQRPEGARSSCGRFLIAGAAFLAGCYGAHEPGGDPGGLDGSPPGAGEAGLRMDAAGIDAGAGPRFAWDAEVRELDPDAARFFDAAGAHSCHEDTIFLPFDGPGCVSLEVSGAEIRECTAPGGYRFSGQPVTILNRVAKHLGIRLEFLGAPGCRGYGCMYWHMDSPEACDCDGGGVFWNDPGEPPAGFGGMQTGIAHSQSAYSFVVGGALSRWLVTVCQRDPVLMTD